MALSQTTNLLARLKLMASGDTNFDEKNFDVSYTLDQTSEEAFHDSQFIDGVVTDKAVSLGGVTTPTFIYVTFQSQFNGDNGTTENAETYVSVKIDGGTAFDANHVLLSVNDVTNDQVTSTITYTTQSDTDTIVKTYVIGRSS
jgi:hypothetical protein